MHKDRGIPSPEPSRRGVESPPTSLEVRDLTNDEILALRMELLSYIEIMQQAFDKASYLFADLNEQYDAYLNKHSDEEDGQQIPEYHYIAEIKYMEDALHKCFMTVGAAVSEIGATIIAVLRVKDADMSIIEPHKLGETFLAELYSMGRNSDKIPYLKRQTNARLISKLSQLLNEQPQLKNHMKLNSAQRQNEDFLENTWWLMRQVRNSITHLKPLPSLFAFWAIGKHYFPELHTTNLAILTDDNDKAEVWNDELDEDAPIIGHEDIDKGIILNHLADGLPTTIYTLKKEALSRNRAGGMRGSGKDAFRGGSK